MKRLLYMVLALVVIACGQGAKPEDLSYAPEVISMSADVTPVEATLSATLAKEVRATAYAFDVSGIGEVPAALQGGKTFQAVVAGLIPEQSYTFQAIVKNASATYRSQISSFTTADIPMPTFGEVSVEPLYFSAEITVPISENTYGADFDYGISVAGADGNWSSFPAYREGDILTGSARKLESETDYQVYAFARRGQKESKSAVKVFKTAASPYDQNFWNYIISNFDVDGNGQISDEEAAKIERLEPAGLNVKSLYGIERFVNLSYLNAGRNEITKVDLSKNLKLTSIELNENQLSGLDVSANTDLESLSLGNCGLPSLDVSSNTKLSRLHIPFNKIPKIDVSKLKNLESVYVDHNQLTELDLSNNPEVWEILCDGNPGLKTVWLKKEQLDKIKVFRKDDFTEIKFK